MNDPVRSAGEAAKMVPASPGHYEELVRQVLAGGRPGEHAALELLLRRRPQCWEDAVALLPPGGVASRRALDALADAWRTYRRIERAERPPG